jgi:cytochrome P450
MGFPCTQMVAPAGTSVLCFLYDYQRSAEYWPKALEFLPERWLPGSDLAPSTPDAWTPFGAGPRMCVGRRFVMQQAVTALVRLYQHQVYRLEPGQVPLKLQQVIALVPTHGVRVRVQRRD